MTQKEVKAAAELYVKRNKVRIAKELTDPKTFPPSDMPISVFMAGSPGAGKTEFSKRLLEILDKNRPKVVRMDGDELRKYLPGYTGGNSKIAWDFTKKRELIEKRSIPKQAFINQFFGAKNTVDRIRSEYGEEVTVFLVKKNYEKNTIEKLIKIEHGDSLDQHIPNIYNKTGLKKAL